MANASAHEHGLFLIGGVTPAHSIMIIIQSMKA